MRLLLRHISRSTIDSIFPTGSPRQLSTRSPIRPSTCTQCRSRPQKRHFAADTKPSASPSSPINSQETPPSTIPENDSPSSTPPLTTHELPSFYETRRSTTSKRLSSLMDNLQGNIFLASQRLNDLTGYSGIEALKTRITTLEQHLSACQEAVRSSRLTYKTTIADRAASQREVTGLLARKDTWTPVDLERFTSLYRSDHGNEQAVQEAATRLAECERAAEQAASKLSSSILSRYHEEQIWSDKIRRMSTWGTWGLMGVNVLLFLVFQFGFEPWRRARLVRGFEEKVKEALMREKENQAHAAGASDGEPAERAMTASSGKDQKLLNGVVAAGIQELEAEMSDDPKNADPAVDTLATVIRSDSITADETTASEPRLSTPSLMRPQTWRPAVVDLFSDRVVSLKRHDVTIIALEGAATGAAFVGLVAMFVLRPN